MSQNSDNDLLEFIEKYEKENNPTDSDSVGKSQVSVSQKTCLSYHSSQAESSWFYSQASEASGAESSQSTANRDNETEASQDGSSSAVSQRSDELFSDRSEELVSVVNTNSQWSCYTDEASSQ
jgi:hypothetical protein